jgi:hypothetical protein
MTQVSDVAPGPLVIISIANLNNCISVIIIH